VLCVAVVALWVRSYWVAEGYAWDDADGGRLSLWNRRGLVDAMRVTPESGSAPLDWLHPPGYAAVAPEGEDLVADSAVLGFLYFRESTGGRRFTTLVTPHYAWVLLTVALPAARAARLIQQRRSRRAALAGLCPACGYDLRGIGDRCPECGWKVARAVDSTGGADAR